jgi:hypothetical protein
MKRATVLEWCISNPLLFVLTTLIVSGILLTACFIYEIKNPSLSVQRESYSCSKQENDKGGELPLLLWSYGMLHGWAR